MSTHIETIHAAATVFAEADAANGARIAIAALARCMRSGCPPGEGEGCDGALATSAACAQCWAEYLAEEAIGCSHVPS
jgi:uncharacterized protein (DUF983 family)